MDPLELHLRQFRESQQTQEQKEQAEQQEAIKQREAQVLGRLDRLRSNADVQWFLEEKVRPIVDAEHDGALAVNGRTAEQRAEHAQRHDIARTIYRLIEIEYRIYLLKVEQHQ